MPNKFGMQPQNWHQEAMLAFAALQDMYSQPGQRTPQQQARIDHLRNRFEEYLARSTLQQAREWKPQDKHGWGEKVNILERNQRAHAPYFNREENWPKQLFMQQKLLESLANSMPARAQDPFAQPVPEPATGPMAQDPFAEPPLSAVNPVPQAPQQMQRVGIGGPMMGEQFQQVPGIGGPRLMMPPQQAPPQPQQAPPGMLQQLMLRLGLGQ